MDKKKKILVAIVGLMASLASGYVVKQKVFKSSDLKEKGVGFLGEFVSPPQPDLENSLTKKQMYDKETVKGQSNEIPVSLEEEKEEEIHDELQQILELQKSLEKVEEYQSDKVAYSNKVVPTKKKKVKKVKKEEEEEPIPQKGSYFFGASSSKKNKSTTNLIPAETIDAGVVSDGSTIGIRLKKPMYFKTTGITIPKGAVIYGLVNFSSEGANSRINIDVAGYRRRNTLYRIGVQAYDFDAREGIHIDNKSIFKIPGKVAKDVYRYAYNRGTQSSPLGGSSNGADLDEAKVIALLSTAKELGEELFIKRKAFIPSKYHLWLSVKEDTFLETESLNAAPKFTSQQRGNQRIYSRGGLSNEEILKLIKQKE